MRRLASLSMLLAFLVAPLAGAAAPAAPVFSLTAKATKVADGSSWQGNGGRQVAVSGNNVYVAFHGPAGEPSVARSTDGGLTWSTPAVLANDAIRGNATGTVRVAIAKDPLYAGKHIVCAAWGTNDDQIFYSYFVDRPTGAGWSAPVSLAGPAGGWAFTVALAAAPNGSVHLIFAGTSGGTYLASATAADAPFSAPVLLPWTSEGANHSMAFDAASDLYVVESHWDLAGTAFVTFHKKAAASSAWSAVDVAVSNASTQLGDNVSIAVFNSSHIYIAYKQYSTAETNPANHVWTAYSSDGGATWTRRPVTPNAAVYGTHPSIAVAANAQGTKVVTVAAHYLDYGPAGRVFVNRSTDNGATWSPNATGPGTQQVSLTLDSAGKALVMSVHNDLSAAEQAFLGGAIDPGWNSRPIYFTREK